MLKRTELVFCMNAGGHVCMQTPQCHQDWDRWYKKYPAAAATPRATTTPNAIFTSEESSMFLTGATMDCYSE